MRSPVVVAMASTRRSRTQSNSRASSAFAPTGASNGASTTEASHSVFAHPRAGGQHLESCSQCSPETEGLHGHNIPSSRTSPRRSSSLSTDLINNDPSSTVIVGGCQECHRNISQRSNSRSNRRTRRSR